MYWCAPQSEVQHEIDRRINTMIATPLYPSTATAAFTWDDSLPLGDRKRLEAWQRHRMDKAIEQAADLMNADNLNFESELDLAETIDKLYDKPIVNINMNADRTNNPALSQEMMTLLRTTKPYSFKHRRGMIGQEHYLVQGIPVFTEMLDLPYKAPFDHHFQRMSTLDFMKTSGNSIHPQLAGTLALWTFCSVLPREVLSSTTLRLSNRVPENAKL